MANTVIQIKRSSSTAVPSSLAAAELAYSYQSQKLYIGTADGLSTIAIGGKFFLDNSNTIFDVVNAAFIAANSAFGGANNVSTQIAPSFNVANAAYAHANASYATQNINYTVTNAAFAHANAGLAHANAAFLASNSVNTYSQATYLNRLTGGTVSGDLTITGNLFFSGNATTISSNNLVVGDSLIYLAANNYTGTDILDIGFVANYANGTGANVHTGLVRDAITKQYYLFNGLDIELQGNNAGFIPYANGVVNAALNADLITSNLSLGGANAIVWIKASYDNGNAAYAHANASYATGNVSYAVTNAAFAHANASYATGNINYALTNASFAHANAGHTHANLAYALANSATAQAANASFMTTGTVDSARISGSYTGITGVGTLTAGVWNATTIDVPYGGTGVTSFTSNGILYGNNTGSLKVTAAATLEGQVLQSSSTGVPSFAMLDGGTF